jgi:hypothetical protein
MRGQTISESQEYPMITKSIFTQRATAAALALSLATSASLLAPKRAEAVVGLVLSATGVASTAGAVLLNLGFFATGAGMFITMAAVGGTLIIDDGRGVHVIPIEGNGSSSLAFAGLLTMAAGVILLDDGSAAGIQLQSLSGAEADRLGLTAQEHTAYEAEREELNLLAQEAQREFQAAKKAGKTEVNLSQLVRDTQGLISQEARSAAAKVAQAALAKIAN